MKTHTKSTRSTVRNVLAIAGLVILAFCLLCAGLLCWIWLYDWHHAYIAREIITPKAEQYLSQTYPDTDYVLDKAYYDILDGYYQVKVHSPSSQDTYFTLDYDGRTFELLRDCYESSVLSGYNTRDRLVSEYTQLIDDCLSSVTCLSYVESDFCQYSENTSPGSYFSPNGLDAKTLVVDKAYDVAEMGSAYGFLEVTAVLPKEEVNIHSALNILTEIDHLLLEQRIGYYLIEITIIDARYPDTTTEFTLYDVHPEDLHRENPLAYLQELWDLQEARRQKRREEWTSASILRTSRNQNAKVAQL